MPLEHFIYMRRDPLLEPSKTECLSIGTFLDCQSTVHHNFVIVEVSRVHDLHQASTDRHLKMN